MGFCWRTQVIAEATSVREFRLANGLCERCGLLPLASKRRCTECLESGREERRTHYKAHRTNHTIRWAEQILYASKRKAMERGYLPLSITPEDLVASYEASNGHCDVCHQASDDLHADHDHKTGALRGWIDKNCNIMLGGARDDVHILSSAIAYLAAHGNLASKG